MDQTPSVTPQDSKTTPAGHTSKRRHRWIWAVVVVLFALVFYWVLHQHRQAAGAGRSATGAGGGTAIPISMVTATVGDLGVYFNAIGTVTSVYTDTITSQVTGVITRVYFREGQYVRKGDPLIDIDPRLYAATLAEAQGALQRDRSTLAEAQMDLARYQEAWKKNAIPRQTLEDQEKQVAIYQGTVKNDEATVDYDKVELSYCHITSPINGRVGLRLVDPGNLATANSTTGLAVVAQMQPITVIFTLSEDNLPEVLQQMRAGHTLEVDAYDRTQQNLLAKGKLITIDNQIDTTTGTVKLRAQFTNTGGVLFPNQFVNTRLLVKTLKNQLLLPSAAIQHNGDVSFVYLIQSGKARMRTVRTGASDGGNTVVEGLNPGDVVADSGFEKLQDGTPVTLVKSTLSGSAGGAAASPASGSNSGGNPKQ